MLDPSIHTDPIHAQAEGGDLEGLTPEKVVGDVSTFGNNVWEWIPILHVGVPVPSNL